MNTVGVFGVCESNFNSTTTTTMPTKIPVETSTILNTDSTKKSVFAACGGHYWPVENNAMSDVIGGKNAVSLKPQFVEDRFGLKNQAILINSSESAWQLPSGRYFQGDTTLTMWIKKNECKIGNYGIVILLVLALGQTRSDRFLVFRRLI
jgi:hypothetical protein